eukprot:m.101196 g.101196  ORF g.101196 m.101196 type:complete len:626 (+) comp37122_c0_seq1:110-1987(+)
MIETIFSSTKSVIGFGRAKYKTFLWDQVIVYISVCVIVMLAVAVGEELFGGGGAVACLTPKNFTRDQAAFVNKMCAEQVKVVRVLPLFLLGELVFLVGPHVLWTKIVGPNLEEFFSLSPTIRRFRDRQTGLFHYESLQTVKLLTSHFKRRKLVYRFYLAKLVIQLIVALAAIAVSYVLYQVVEVAEYGTTFACPVDERVYTNNWFRSELDALCDNYSSVLHPSYNISVNISSCTKDSPAILPCAFTLGLLFVPLWYANFPLLALAAMMVTYGLTKLFILPKRCVSSHRKQLDVCGKAKFLYGFCAYKPSDSFRYGPDSPEGRIKNDLEFLSLLLAATDKGLGKSFFEHQVDIELERLWEEQYRNYLANKMTNRNNDRNSQSNENEESSCKMCPLFTGRSETCSVSEDQENRNVSSPVAFPEAMLCWLKHKKFQLGLHLFCGPRGAIVAISKLCEQLVAVDFNQHLNPLHERESSELGEAEPKIEARKVTYRNDYEKLQIYAVPGDLLTRVDSQRKEILTRLREHPKRISSGSTKEYAQYDLVIVTDFEEEDRTTTANHFLDALNSVHPSCFTSTTYLVCTNSKQRTRNLISRIPRGKVAREKQAKCKSGSYTQMVFYQDSKSTAV